jgi:EpsI family protein
MIINRLVTLLLMLLIGMSGIYVLPSSPKRQPSGVDLALPATVGKWQGKDVEISEYERGSLGPDTEFARKVYTNEQGDEIFASIVLAGQDMNRSIHRPERCLPAQGWTIADSKTVSVPVGDNKVIRATRLHDMRMAQTKSSQRTRIYNLNYYWFVGYTDLTPSHTERTFIDIRDRLLRGYNQRWAYITIASIIPKSYNPEGKSEEDVDQIVQSFIKEISPKILKSSVHYNSI